MSPEIRKKKKTMTAKARNYCIMNDHLYRKGVCTPLLKCISHDEGKDLLQEIHGYGCSSHISTMALVKKTFKKAFTGP